jgi:hypothetical protein
VAQVMEAEVRETGLGYGPFPGLPERGGGPALRAREKEIRIDPAP